MKEEVPDLTNEFPFKDFGKAYNKARFELEVPMFLFHPGKSKSNPSGLYDSSETSGYTDPKYVAGLKCDDKFWHTVYHDESSTIGGPLNPAVVKLSNVISGTDGAGGCD